MLASVLRCCSPACLGSARPVLMLSLAAEEPVLGTRRPIGPAGVRPATATSAAWSSKDTDEAC